MRLAYLLSILLVIRAVAAERVLLASAVDTYGIVAAAQSGNESAAVSGFVVAGNAADVTSVTAALGEIFGTVIGEEMKRVTVVARAERALATRAACVTPHVVS